MIPESAHDRQAIFDAAPDETYRALWLLTYGTAARPESESCKILRGDVLFPVEGVTEIDGLPTMGLVKYRQTKTRRISGRGYREIPLAPEVAEALRKIIPEAPEDPLELARWKQVPVFSKRGQPNTPMDRFSYRKAWEAAIKKVVAGNERSGIPACPHLAGMVLRDFRATAKTVMIDAEVPEATVDKILGHGGGVRDGYYRPDLAMKLAVLTLFGESLYPDLYLGVRTARNRRKAGTS